MCEKEINILIQWHTDETIGHRHTNTIKYIKH